MILECINDTYPNKAKLPFGHPVKGELYNAVARCETPEPGFELAEFPRFQANGKQHIQYWAAWRFRVFKLDDVDISDLELVKPKETFVS